MSEQLGNWLTEKDSDGILWAGLDVKEKSANVMDSGTIETLRIIVDSVARDTTIIGLVIYSIKESGFIAGADVSQFSNFDDKEKVMGFIKLGHEVFNALSRLETPTLALIDGFCLGGGLELSLACRYRIASNSPKTKIGLPEVKLGIHPGWGGCVRLPKLIGSMKALELIVQGSVLSARASKKFGLVDDVVPHRQLKNAARYYILNEPKIQKPPFYEIAFILRPFRQLLVHLFKNKMKQKGVIQKHYPAPFAVLDLFQVYGTSDTALKAEIASIENIITENKTAENLIRLFFLQEKLKGLAKDIAFSPTHVHVIGGGTMGGDIAAWCALKGFRVTLEDREYQFLDKAFKRAHKLFKKKVRDKRVRAHIIDNLIPDIHGEGIKSADVIIEAVFEDLAVKQEIFKKIEKYAKEDAIIATNTSSIPLDQIYKVLNNTTRLVGIHFFNPVSKMPLVEIVHDHNTNKGAFRKAIRFVKLLDRLPLPVLSKPGFLVNRVLMPYLMESMQLLEEGIPMDVIDKAATNYGMPMGPIELADTVGLDVCLSVAKNLSSHYEISIPSMLEEKVEQQELGRKTNAGFYKYKGGKIIRDKHNAHDYDDDKQLDITHRLIFRMVNEAIQCLKDGIVGEPDLLDVGMVFGTGFAPFRGGPIHYMSSYSEDKIEELTSSLAHRYGERFKPDPKWSKIIN